LQGIEFYKDGVIYYSLGNFTFGSYSKTARTSALARITLKGPEVSKAEILPLSVYNQEVFFQPRPLTDGPANSFAREFDAICEPFDTTLKRQPDLFWEVVPKATPLP
jgi:poly-gamma-glutamate synthesis protein (capsule biosynthesis protein)